MTHQEFSVGQQLVVSLPSMKKVRIEASVVAFDKRESGNQLRIAFLQSCPSSFLTNAIRGESR